MRTGTVSTLCAFLLLICSPRPTVGQSNPSNQFAISQNPPASTKSFELPKAAETATVPAQAHSTNQFTNSLQSWSLLTQQNGSNLDQLWSFKKGTLPQLETTRCAHMVIFPAPDTDPEMIVEAPPGLGGTITTYRGFEACCRDLRGPLGLPSIAPRAPRVQPPFVLPRKNGQPLPNFENWQNRLHH